MEEIKMRIDLSSKKNIFSDQEIELKSKNFITSLRKDCPNRIHLEQPLKQKATQGKSKQKSP